MDRRGSIRLPREPLDTSSQAWLLTFSDLLLLLLTMFVLKLSMSSLSFSSLSQATNLRNAGESQTVKQLTTANSRPWAEDPNLLSPTRISVDTFVDRIASSQGGLQVEVGLPAHLRVKSSPSLAYDGETLTVWISHRVFSENSTELTFEGQEVIRTIAKAAAITGFSAKITAYEPNSALEKPNGEEISTNSWTLARERAVQVVRQFIDAGVGATSLEASSDICSDQFSGCPFGHSEIEISIILPRVTARLSDFNSSKFENQPITDLSGSTPLR